MISLRSVGPPLCVPRDADGWPRFLNGEITHQVPAMPGLFHLWLNAVLTRAPVETRVPAKAPKTVHFRHHAKASRSPFMKRGGLGCLPRYPGGGGFRALPARGHGRILTGLVPARSKASSSPRFPAP